MKTKLLEAKAIIKDKVYNILNTDMDILVDWSVMLVKNEETAFVNIVFDKVYGNFNIVSSAETYTKKTTFMFSSDDTWSLKHKLEYDFNQPLFPSSAIINFDKKTIDIKL